MIRQSNPLWSRTPPAIFPPILGLFGLGMAFRRATPTFGLAPGWGEALLGAVSLLYLFALVAYLSKPLRRPATVTEDLQILPGRGGLAAATVGMMMFAATLVPYYPSLAKTLTVVSLLVQLFLMFLVLRVLLQGPAVQSRVTPIWHLSFVGAIVAPLAAIPLGWVQLSTTIFIATLPIAIMIWTVSLWQLSRETVPAPLRPLLAIHLAPVSLMGTVSALLGYNVVAIGFGIAAIAVLAVMLWHARAMTEAGFSALWGSFTFPMAAFAGLMLLLGEQHGAFRLVGGLALVGATMAVPPIALKIMQAWSKGALSVKTNASQV